MRLISVFVLFLVLTSSCDNFTRDQKVYEAELQQFHFKLTPLKTESLMERNYVSSKLSTTEEKLVIEEYNNFLYYTMDIKIEDFDCDITEYYDKFDGKGDYDRLLNYYLFEMQNDLSLKGPDGEKIPCTIYYFERNYSLTQTNRFMIGFRKPTGSGEAVISYDNRILNLGRINFQVQYNNDFKS